MEERFFVTLNMLSDNNVWMMMFFVNLIFKFLDQRKKEDKETINQDAEQATDDTFNSLAYE